MVKARTDKLTGTALGTGRRKTSIARVRIGKGSGNISINGRKLDDYFPNVRQRNAVIDPLQAAGQHQSVDVAISVEGGGPSGQAGACRMGIARALVSLDSELYQALRDGGHLTRDSRMKERKKYGLRGARRGTQFSKR
jgi:small subunit ribosomal protein S9